MLGQGTISWDDFADDIRAEPTDDVFVQTLTAGLADGTLALSESESDEWDDDGKQTKQYISSARLICK